MLLLLPIIPLVFLLLGPGCGPDPKSGTNCVQAINVAPNSKDSGALKDFESFAQPSDYLSANQSQMLGLQGEITTILTAAQGHNPAQPHDPQIITLSQEIINDLQSITQNASSNPSKALGFASDLQTAKDKLASLLASSNQKIVGDFAFPIEIKGSNPAYTDSYGAARPDGRVHRGTDMLTPEGTNLIAVTDGKIRGIGSVDAWGKQKLTIVPDTGTHEYLYAHIINVKVRNGQHVTKGQIIAQSGDANGVQHLHFAIEVPCSESADKERADLSTCCTNPVPFLKAADPRT